MLGLGEGLKIVLLNLSSEPTLFRRLQRERTDEDSVGEVSLLAKDFPNAIISGVGRRRMDF